MTGGGEAGGGGTGALRRLDAVLRERHPGLSRAEVAEAVASGAVRVNGRRAAKGTKVGTGDEIDDAALEALRFVVSAPAKQLLSFRLEGHSGALFASATERYLLIHAERGFSTLDYWKKIKL